MVTNTLEFISDEDATMRGKMGRHGPRSCPQLFTLVFISPKAGMRVHSDRPTTGPGRSIRFWAIRVAKGLWEITESVYRYTGSPKWKKTAVRTTEAVQCLKGGSKDEPLSWITALSQQRGLHNSKEALSHSVQGHPKWMGHSGEFYQNMVHCRREWQTTTVFLPWESHE